MEIQLEGLHLIHDNSVQHVRILNHFEKCYNAMSKKGNNLHLLNTYFHLTILVTG